MVLRTQEQSAEIDERAFTPNGFIKSSSAIRIPIIPIYGELPIRHNVMRVISARPGMVVQTLPAPTRSAVPAIMC